MAGLVEQGRRVIAPFIRGCGPTRFLNDEIPRAGDFAALGQDALNLVEALNLSNLVVAGQDWGHQRQKSLQCSFPIEFLGSLSSTGMAFTQ